MRERWPISWERAARKTWEAMPSQAVVPLVKMAQKGSTAIKWVFWLQRAVSAWAQLLQRVAACRRGCSHCRHRAVTISGIEAALIRRHFGRAPAQPALAVRLDAFADVADAVDVLHSLNNAMASSPCPFLHQNACSICEVRPTACRLLLNLDNDLLCRRLPGQEIPVPCADSNPAQGLCLMAQPATPMADSRTFFARQSPLGEALADRPP